MKSTQSGSQPAKLLASISTNTSGETAKEVEALEPKANLNIKGAVYFHSDAHMTPGGFMKNMLAYLKSQGVAILAEEEVKDIIISNNSIKKVITNK